MIAPSSAIRPALYRLRALAVLEYTPTGTATRVPGTLDWISIMPSPWAAPSPRYRFPQPSACSALYSILQNRKGGGRAEACLPCGMHARRRTGIDAWANVDSIGALKINRARLKCPAAVSR